MGPNILYNTSLTPSYYLDGEKKDGNKSPVDSRLSASRHSNRSTNRADLAAKRKREMRENLEVCLVCHMWHSLYFVIYLSIN